MASSIIGLDSVLTDQDKREIVARGSTLEQVEQHLEQFQNGIRPVHVDRPCTIDDGIISLTNHQLISLSHEYAEAVADGRVMKFVPASGAASRMFQALLNCLSRLTSAQNLTEPEKLALTQFSERMAHFAFYEDLASSVSKQGSNIDSLRAGGRIQPILEHLLAPYGLNYANMPKGLLKFHRYPEGARTPIEEHLVEAQGYALDRHRQARVHFTISREHQEAMRIHWEDVRKRLAHTGVEFHLTYSLQKPATDTIAVDLQNRPVRDEYGRLLFRPAGHGALLENLHELQGDLLFVKNIDNVVPDRLKEDTYVYKRAMAGLVVSLQKRIAAYLNRLTTEHVSEHDLETIATFARHELMIHVPREWQTWNRGQKIQYVTAKLNRPIRVCGMVKNTGDPGGGPFWVTHDDGSTTVQIVEAAQINLQDSGQQQLLKSSTHFNPVDMVCAVRDFRGRPFNLLAFRDPDTGFITHKSYRGRPIKALELPGLWNGGMADWITIFLEVPRSTFHPVKTVFDLLRPEHQPRSGSSS